MVVWIGQKTELNTWLVVSTPLKNISQLGWLFPRYGNIKFMFQTTNQRYEYIPTIPLSSHIKLYWSPLCLITGGYVDWIGRLATFPKADSRVLWLRVSLKRRRWAMHSSDTACCHWEASWTTWDLQRTFHEKPSGKLKSLWKITTFNGKTHYKWEMFVDFWSRSVVEWTFIDLMVLMDSSFMRFNGYF